mmetsp:Transcript_22422/g.45749  ORF Transcript_22422/g.45749 Transcript_22422/m.45749 type:complete len:241 (+) Transcript_22422:262-984(+)
MRAVDSERVSGRKFRTQLWVQTMNSMNRTIVAVLSLPLCPARTHASNTALSDANKHNPPWWINQVRHRLSTFHQEDCSNGLLCKHGPRASPLPQGQERARATSGAATRRGRPRAAVPATGARHRYPRDEPRAAPRGFDRKCRRPWFRERPRDVLPTTFSNGCMGSASATSPPSFGPFDISSSVFSTRSLRERSSAGAVCYCCLSGMPCCHGFVERTNEALNRSKGIHFPEKHKQDVDHTV